MALGGTVWSTSVLFFVPLDFIKKWRRNAIFSIRRHEGKDQRFAHVLKKDIQSHTEWFYYLPNTARMSDFHQTKPSTCSRKVVIRYVAIHVLFVSVGRYNQTKQQSVRF